jgi:hypothetical protein
VFTDGSHDGIDVIVCATGYELDIPYLDDDVWALTGPELRLHCRTLHPDLPGLGFIGQYSTSGPYFPLLELQARWIANLWAGIIDPPGDAEMRASVVEAPPILDSHDGLALLFAEASGVAPDLDTRPDLLEPLLFGPMLPPRYRIDGPGALPGAAEHLLTQMATSPRPPTEPEDLDSLPRLGLPPLPALQI